ncbi:MAG: hypothetical protein ACK5SP_01980 [bacterium]|jgi:hypothetical protein
MNNNHIGTAFEVMKDIADLEGWNYSHGTLTEFDFKAFLVFPLMHCSIQSVALTDQVATIQMNIMVADRVNFLKTENEQENLITEYSQYGYTENQNYANILQDLYVRFSKGLWRTEQDYFNQIQYIRPITFQPFMETLDSVLAGYQITVGIELINPWVTDGDCV